MTTSYRDPIRCVAVVGAGVIGSQLAAFYAWKGTTVHLYDASPTARDRVPTTIRAHLDVLREHGVMSVEAAGEAEQRVQVAATLAAAVAGADFVQEAAPERYDVKEAVFAEVDGLAAPDVLIASSSSGLSITRIQAVTRHPQRCLVDHPMYPAHLMPLVELVPGRDTDPAAVEQARRFFEGLGKVTVTLKQEVPGYLINRLVVLVWRECADLVRRGVVSGEDLDRAIAHGPAIRWSVAGPMRFYQSAVARGGQAAVDFLQPLYERYIDDMAAWTQVPDDVHAALANDSAARPKLGDDESQRRQWDSDLVSLLQYLGHLPGK